MGEQPLPKNGCCNLGSINLSEYVLNPFEENARFDFDTLCDDIRTCYIALDELIDENAGRHPLKEQNENSLNWRNIGLGIMGYADMLMKLRKTYGSENAKKFTDTLFDTIFMEAYSQNIRLSKERCLFPKWTPVHISSIEHAHKIKADNNIQYPLHNCSMLSIAPTGSLSTMLGVSGGIEPEFAISYERRTVALGGEEDKVYTVYCKTAQEYLDKFNTNTLPEYFVSSADINWKDRINTQSVIQKHIDTAISSTINLPHETKVEDIEQLYLYAWKNNLKGITIFRDGCKRLGILTTDKKSEKKSPETSDKTIYYNTIKPVSRKTLGTTSGKTYCKKCACGTLYITVNTNENGNIVETFVHTSKGGVCQANLNGLNRMISTALRSGVMVSEIIDQLSAINCPACTTLKAKGTKLDGLSCPDIVAKTLKEFTTLEKSDVEKVEQISEMCPECGAPLNHEGGCVTCGSCGYSKCG